MDLMFHVERRAAVQWTCTWCFEGCFFCDYQGSWKRIEKNQRNKEKMAYQQMQTHTYTHTHTHTHTHTRQESTPGPQKKKSVLVVLGAAAPPLPPLKSFLEKKPELFLLGAFGSGEAKKKRKRHAQTDAGGDTEEEHEEHGDSVSTHNHF
jgi:hypothetical protein